MLDALNEPVTVFLQNWKSFWEDAGDDDLKSIYTQSSRIRSVSVLYSFRDPDVYALIFTPVTIWDVPLSNWKFIVSYDSYY